MPRKALNWSGAKVEGLEEARQMMEDCKRAFTPDLIQGAILPAARIIRDDAKRRVNRGAGHYMAAARKLSATGKLAVKLGLAQAPSTAGFTTELLHLQDQIFATRGKRGASDVIAGVDLKKAPHAHLVEFGTKAHVIRPRAPKKFLVLFGRIFVPQVNHPGAQKYPYLRPAVTSTRSRVSESIRLGLATLLGKRMRPTYGPVISEGGGFMGSELP